MAQILVVDDEDDIRTLMRAILEAGGHKVQTAANGAEALALVGIEPVAEKPLPDLIISDVLMPVLDGHAMTERLVENSKTRKIPLIILTARGGTRDLFKLSANIKAFIEKPFNPKALRDAVSQTLTLDGTP